MKNIKFLIIFLVGFLVVGCANTDFNHEYVMRGQVVEQTAGNTVVCIGTYDGAKVGQQLSVLRFVRELAVAEGDDPYAVDNVGKVEVIEIINDHFARIRTIEGEVKVNDIVELKK